MAAAIAGTAILGAVGQNVAHNRKKAPVVSQEVIRKPDSSIDNQEMGEINLGSDRASYKFKRGTGKRKLMAEQTPSVTPTTPTTGLQI